MNPSEDKQGAELDRLLDEFQSECFGYATASSEQTRRLIDHDIQELRKQIHAASSSCAATDPGLLHRALPFIGKAFAETPHLQSGARFDIYRELVRACEKELARPESETPKEYPVSMTMEKYHEFLAYEAECKLRDARSATTDTVAVPRERLEDWARALRNRNCRGEYVDGIEIEIRNEYLKEETPLSATEAHK